MIITQLGNVKTRISNETELNLIGNIRYKAYLSNQSIDENSSQLFLDKYDYDDHCTNHIAYQGEKAVGAIRGCIYHSSLGNTLPSFEMFYNEIDKEIGLSEKIFESCRFVTLPELTKVFYANLALIKTNCIMSYAYDCQHTITAVREKHLEFYEKMGFYKCSDPKVYSGLNVKMILLMGKDSQSYMDNLVNTFKLLAHTEADRKNYLACEKKLHLL